MISQLVNISFPGNTLKEIDKILVSRGLTRRTVIKGDNLQAVGEAGIGLFHITLEDKTTLKIEARNRQAFEIIHNLLLVELEDLKEKYQEIEQQSKDNPDEEYLCLACHIPLEFFGEKLLGDDLKTRIFTCPRCKKLEFYALGH